MGDQQYSSIHIRKGSRWWRERIVPCQPRSFLGFPSFSLPLSGDFQHSHLRELPCELILKNVEGLFNPGETIYIATDERDKNFFQPFKDKFKVKFYDDFATTLASQRIPSHLIGNIEMMVATRARVFVGTALSTFTSFIQCSRGWARDVSSNIYDTSHRWPTDYGPSWTMGGGSSCAWCRAFPEAWNEI